jgi:hypothetical protein
LLEEYREKVRVYTTLFRAASPRWRSGDFAATFPSGANRPMVVIAG